MKTATHGRQGMAEFSFKPVEGIAMDEQPNKAQAWLDSQGLTYTAEFVPQSKSRNANEKQPSLNWRVTFEPRIESAADSIHWPPRIETDYMQGIGHLPHYSHQFARLRVYDAAVRDACETGKSRLRSGQRNGWDACHRPVAAAIPKPEAVDVMYCLVSDADVLNHSTFEEWADEYGYDVDSRAAEKIYRQCLENALKLRRLVDLDKAAEAFEDF